MKNAKNNTINPRNQNPAEPVEYVEIPILPKSGQELHAVIPRKPPIEKIFCLVILKIMLALEGLELRFRSVNFDDADIEAYERAGFIKVGVGDSKYNDRLLPNGKIAGSDTEVIVYGLRVHEKLETLTKSGEVNCQEAKKLRLFMRMVEMANINNETGGLKDAGLGGDAWNNDMCAFLLRKAYDVWDPEMGQDHPYHPVNVIRHSMHVIETCTEAFLQENPRAEEAPHRLQSLFLTRLDNEGNIRYFCLGHYVWAMWQVGFSESEVETQLGYWRSAQKEIEKIYRRARVRKAEILQAELERGVTSETAEKLLKQVFSEGVEEYLGRRLFGPQEQYLLFVLVEPDSTVISELWNKTKNDPKEYEVPHVIINEQQVIDENSGKPLGTRFAILTRGGLPIDLVGVRDEVRERAYEQQRAKGVPEDKLQDPCFFEYRRGGEVNRIFVNGSDFWDKPWRVQLTLEELVAIFLKYVKIGDAPAKAEGLPLDRIKPSILQDLQAGLSSVGKNWADRRPTKKS